jgi:hypothetical protein
VFLSDFLPEKWQTVLKNGISVRIYHEVLKNLAESIRNFSRKSDMFSILGGLDPPAPPPNREAWGVKRTSVLLVLLCTSLYFSVLLCTSSYFSGVLRTSWDFCGLPGTSLNFPGLLGISSYFCTSEVQKSAFSPLAYPFSKDCCTYPFSETQK